MKIWKVPGDKRLQEKTCRFLANCPSNKLPNWYESLLLFSDWNFFETLRTCTPKVISLIDKEASCRASFQADNDLCVANSQNLNFKKSRLKMLLKNKFTKPPSFWLKKEQQENVLRTRNECVTHRENCYVIFKHPAVPGGTLVGHYRRAISVLLYSSRLCA